MKGVKKKSKYGSSIYKRKDGRWEGRYVVGYKNNHAVCEQTICSRKEGVWFYSDEYDNKTL